MRWAAIPHLADGPPEDQRLDLIAFKVPVRERSVVLRQPITTRKGRQRSRG